jgi:hypothetical protein
MTTLCNQLHVLHVFSIAYVTPLLKKSTFDASDVRSYQFISGLCYLKTAVAVDCKTAYELSEAGLQISQLRLPNWNYFSGDSGSIARQFFGD